MQLRKLWEIMALVTIILASSSGCIDIENKEEIQGIIGKWLSDGKTSVIVYSVKEDVYHNPITLYNNPMYVIKFQIKNPADHTVVINSFDITIYHPEKILEIHSEGTDKKPYKLAPGETLLEPGAGTVDTDGHIFPSKPTKFYIKIHLDDMGTSSYIVSL